MKKLLISAAAITAAALPTAALGMSYGLYRYICYSDPKTHTTGEDYLDSKYLKPHGDLMFPKLKALLVRPCETVSIQSHDGLSLNGRFYKGTAKDRFVIMMHGYRAQAFGDFCGTFTVFDELGWNILLIDERACGESEGKTISFGVEERLDCMNWANYLTDRWGKQIEIVLFGMSMGAATVMMAANLKLPETVKAIVADCGFTSPKEIIMNTAKNQGFPERFCWPFARVGLKLFGRFDPMEASARRAVSETRVPILIIHGTADHYVPFEMSRELKKYGGSMVRVYPVEGAAHVQSYQTDPAGYTAAVHDFLNEVLEEKV